MIYQFENAAGEVVDRFWPDEDWRSARIGMSIEDPDNPGQKLTRILSKPGRPVVKECRHVAHSLPRVVDGEKEAARFELRARWHEREAGASKDEGEKAGLLATADELRGEARAIKDTKPYWSKHTADGKPVCETKADVQELSARMERRFGWDAGD